MEIVFAIGIALLSLALVVLITLQPRQQQSLSTDATSNLGKPSYWRSHRGLKLATLAVSIVFLLSLFLYMLMVQAQLFVKQIEEVGTKVLASSCFWIVEQDAVVECSKHCFEVADRTCEASILSLCSLFKLQRCPMLTETMFPLSATFNSLPDC